MRARLPAAPAHVAAARRSSTSPRSCRGPVCRKRACYGASKGAVLRAHPGDGGRLRRASGIRVNCVCPGTVDTPWVGRLLAAAPDPTAARAGLVARQPIGRLGTAEEIAAAIIYLASPAAGYVDRHRAADRRRHARLRGAAGSSALDDDHAACARSTCARRPRAPSPAPTPCTPIPTTRPPTCSSRPTAAHEGIGMTFTIGRGNELVLRGDRGARAARRRPRARGARRRRRRRSGGALTNDGQLRWLGPEKGVIHLATAAIVNAVWDLWAKARGQAALAARRRPDARAVRRPASTSATSPTCSTATRRSTCCARAQPARPRAIAELRRDGYPAYLTSAGWLGYPEEKVRRLCREALADGWRASRPRSASTSPPTSAAAR